MRVSVFLPVAFGLILSPGVCVCADAQSGDDHHASPHHHDHGTKGHPSDGGASDSKPAPEHGCECTSAPGDATLESVANWTPDQASDFFSVIPTDTGVTPISTDVVTARDTGPPHLDRLPLYLTLHRLVI